MEAAAIEAMSPGLVEEVAAALGLAQPSLVGGFENFVYKTGDLVLRLTHNSHRSRDQLLAEMEWLDFLYRSGAPVAAPVPQLEWVTEFGEFCACVFRAAPGRTITQADWGAPLFESWGHAIGQFHKLARQFAPVNSRWSWREDANFDLHARIPPGQGEVLALADQTLAQLAALPAGPDIFGLVHADAHPGNYFLDGECLTFFDFDDCHYSWLAFDIASILFSVVNQPWIGTPQAEKVHAAGEFLQPFLDGYRRFTPLQSFTLVEMPTFLRLRELSQYAIISAQMDVDNLDDPYAARFMQGRRARLEAGEPFLNLDFVRFG